MAFTIKTVSLVGLFGLSYPLPPPITKSSEEMCVTNSPLHLQHLEQYLVHSSLVWTEWMNELIQRAIPSTIRTENLSELQASRETSIFHQHKKVSQLLSFSINVSLLNNYCWVIYWLLCDKVWEGFMCWVQIQSVMTTQPHLKPRCSLLRMELILSARASPLDFPNHFINGMIYLSYHLHKVTVKRLPAKPLNSSKERSPQNWGSLKLSTKGWWALERGMTAKLHGQPQFSPPINIWISVSWDPFSVLRQLVSPTGEKATGEISKTHASITSKLIQTSEANVENCHRWIKTSHTHTRPSLSSSVG